MTKKNKLKFIEKHEFNLIEIWNQIWSLGATAHEENVTAKTLVDHAKEQGFIVEKGMAYTSDAFIKSYSWGKPLISVLEELC